MTSQDLFKLQQESKARHLSQFQKIQNSKHFINDPDDDSIAERYLKRIYRTSSCIEEIKKKLAVRLNMKYDFFDESVLPKKQPEVIVDNESSIYSIVAKQKQSIDWTKVNFNNAKAIVEIPATKKESLPVDKKNKIDAKKIKKFAEEPPKKIERPKAVYSNIPSPYGISDELRNQE